MLVGFGKNIKAERVPLVFIYSKNLEIILARTSFCGRLLENPAEQTAQHTEQAMSKQTPKNQTVYRLHEDDVARHYQTIALRALACKGAAQVEYNAKGTHYRVTVKDQKRLDKLTHLSTQAIAVELGEFSDKYAQAQFASSSKDFTVHLTTIYPSGKGHCTCSGHNHRSGGRRQEAVCQHIGALAKNVFDNIRTGA